MYHTAVAACGSICSSVVSQLLRGFGFSGEHAWESELTVLVLSREGGNQSKRIEMVVLEIMSRSWFLILLRAPNV